MKSIRAISLVTVLVMAVLTFPVSAAGADTAAAQDSPSAASQQSIPGEDEHKVSDDEAKRIVSFYPLSDEVAYQSGNVKTDFTPVLPETLTVRLEKENGTEKAVIPVTWTSSPVYQADKAGEYLFSPQLPEGYQAESGIVPEIQVTLDKQETSVDGLNLTVKKKARSKLANPITVSPAYGRDVRLQMKVKDKWVTKKTYTLEDAQSADLTVDYTNDWWKAEQSSWRLVIKESDEGTSYTSPVVTISTQRYYQTPGNYFKIKNAIPVRKSGYTLKTGMSGYKVYKVQKRLGCYQGKAKYTAATAKKVKQFQKKKNLKATGKVNKATWLKMGFSEKDWYYLDSYVTPIKVDPSSTKADHINAMVETAKSYVGTQYIWCASAKPKQGVDCAGMVIQCLYAAGIDPLPQGSHVYAYSRNEYTTRKMWANKKFKHVKYSQKKKGDIIVYHNGKGVVNHVSLYIGGGMEIESTPGKARYSKAGGRVKGVLRPII